MRFISTRGGEPCGFLQALTRGRAPDGGLYLPQEWPHLTLEDIAAAGRRSLAETVETVLLRFSGLELDPELTLSVTREAFTAFGHPAVAPLRELDPGLWLLDLARGPTQTAADIEMQVLARLVSQGVASRGRSVNLVLATTGEDGPAAVEAFRDRAGIGLVVLFPADGVTPAQRRALTDASARNVRAIEVDGDGQACRALVEAALSDEQLVEEARLGTIGPENIARLAIGAAVVLAAAARLGAPERPLSLAAPAGPWTLDAAGWTLDQMGLGLERIIVVEHGESRLAAGLDGGRYRRAADAVRLPWDQQPDWPAAFERFYFEASGRQVVETTRAARAYSDAGAIDLPPGVRQRLGRLRGVGADATEAAAAAMAARNVAGERLDRDSAAVLSGARRLASGLAGPLICPVLAHPAWTAVGALAEEFEPSDLPPQLRRPVGEERCDRLAAHPQALGAYLRAFAGLSRAA